MAAVTSFCRAGELPASAAAPAKVPVTEAPAALPLSRASWTLSEQVGVSAEDEILASDLELLAPIWQNEDSLVFLYPETNIWNRDRQMTSIGLGVRSQMDLLVPAILGANVFYDHTEGFYGMSTDQLGAGLEVLTDWFDFRLNGYFNLTDQELVDSQRQTSVKSSVASSTRSDVVGVGNPFALNNGIYRNDTFRDVTTTRTTTTRTTQYYENFAQPMNGVDAEIGFLVPWLPKYQIDLRVYAGAYHYSDPFGEKDLTGFKARAEARLGQYVRMDLAYHQDKEITGGNWFAGLRFTVPLGGAEAAPARSADGLLPLSSRMSELVERNSRPVVAQSGYEENVAKRQVESSVTSKTRTRMATRRTTLAKDVVFANSGGEVLNSVGQPHNGVGAGSAAGDGTAAHPYDTVQAAVFRAGQLWLAHGGTPTVYAQGGTLNGNYSGDVTLYSPLRMLTSSSDAFGLNAGAAPEFQGATRLQGGVIAHNIHGLVELNGWTMTGGGSGTGIGVELLNVRSTLLQNNHLSQMSGRGLEFTAFADTTLDLAVRNNVIHDTAEGMQFTTSGATINGDISGNEIINNGDGTLGHGIRLRSGGLNSHWNADIVGNTINDNQLSGLYVEATQHASSSFSGDIRNNEFDRNGSAAAYGGLEIAASGGGTWTGEITGNTFFKNFGNGATIHQSNGTFWNAPISQNLFVVNSGHGLELNANNATHWGILFDNTFSANGRHGALLNITGTTQWSGGLIDNTAQNNMRSGLVVGDSTHVGWTGQHYGDVGLNTVTGNGENGLEFYLAGAEAHVAYYDNVFSQNTLDGLYMRSGIGGSWTGQLTRNTANQNGGNGADIRLVNSTWLGDLTLNTFDDNGGNGLFIDHNAGTFSSLVSENSFRDNGADGAEIRSNGLANLSFTSNNANGNGAIGTELWGWGTWNGNITGNNWANNNAAASPPFGAGFYFHDDGNGLAYHGNFQSNAAVNNEFWNYFINLTGSVTGAHTGGNYSLGSTNGNSFTLDFGP